ncbi:MAG: hypothetical protein L7U25_04800 [Candidatus Poseidonia sp.]|nr:hypothetical protein [Poseidonia sp.]
MSDVPTADELRRDEGAEDEEAWEAAQEAAKLLDTLRGEVTPTRVAMAGAVVLLFIVLAVSGWYWILPRDSVTLETHYMQRGGHLMMTEIHNDGSRAITDVSLEIEFQTSDGEVIETMSLELARVEGHTSISGDELEMMVIGYTIWDDYIIVVDLTYTDYSGELRQESWPHNVGVWSQEIFFDKADRHFWPLN